MEFLHTLYCQYPGMLHLYIGILGLLVGSFLNVVVYRLPVMMENEYRRDFLEYFTPDSQEQKKEQPKFNLMTPVFPFRKPFHVIFCRNVMIYFDTPTRDALVRKFYDFLEPGGFLFVGHSEVIDRQSAPFEYVMPSVYRKK